MQLSHSPRLPQVSFVGLVGPVALVAALCLSTPAFAQERLDSAVWIEAETLVLDENTSVFENEAPVAVDDGCYRVIAGAQLVIEAAELLGNDFDPDGDSLQIRTVSGTTTYDGDVIVYQSFIELGAGETYQDIFYYIVEDSYGATAIARVCVTVIGVNDAPVALDDGCYEVSAGALLVIDPAELLHNDFDPDGDPLQIRSVSGTATYDGDVIVYQSFIEFGEAETYQDIFYYIVEDSYGATAIARVCVLVHRD